MNEALTKLLWILAISFGVCLYLLFLFSLPNFLERHNMRDGGNEGENVQEEEKNTGKDS